MFAVLINGLPADSEFGIDCIRYTYTNKANNVFGILEIPSGMHLLHYQLSGSIEIHWQFIHPNLVNNPPVFTDGVQNIIELVWDAEHEVLVCVPNPGELYRSILHQDFSSCFVRFSSVMDSQARKNLIGVWKGLSSYISVNVLDFCGANSLAIFTGSQYSDIPDKIKSKQKVLLSFNARGALENDSRELENELRGSQELLTLANLDKSQYLIKASITNHGRRLDGLLGEFQHSFLTFICGERWEGFLQWKKLFISLCDAYHLMKVEPEFYGHYVEVLQYQLEELPKDFFTTEISKKDNFIRKSLEALVELSDGLEFSYGVSKLVELTKKRFKVKINSFSELNLNDEDAPVFVEL